MAEYIGWITSNQTFNDGYLTSPGDSNNLQIHLPPSDQTEPQYINSNFQYLRNLLTEQERKISYLDLYRIDKYLGKDEISTIGSAFAQLLPCHAIGINAAAARYHDINLNKGDLLLKAANGEPVRIEAPGNGMYYPQTIFENDQYYIKWYYTAEDDDNENLTGYTYYKAQEDIPSTETKGFYYDGIELKNKDGSQLLDLPSASFNPFKDYKFLLPDQDNNNNRGQAIIRSIPSDGVISSQDIEVLNNFPIVSLYHVLNNNNNAYWEEVCDNTLSITTEIHNNKEYYRIAMTKNSYINTAVIKIPQSTS